MSGPRPVVHARSAGGVVWRHDARQIEVVVCHRTSPQITGLPKGTPEPGETAAATALREVREETGLDVELGKSLGATEYWFAAGGARVRKTVRWWLMTATGGDVANHDHEFDAVEWVSAAEALARLSYPDERALVEKAVEIITASSAYDRAR